MGFDFKQVFLCIKYLLTEELMKKILCLIIVTTITLSISIMFTSCGEKDYTNYKNEEGYVEYISYADKGSKYASYYAIPMAIDENEKARRYYENNIRQCGDFMVTNYLDGICVNDYVGEIDDDSTGIVIPETLDGKPVIAIGSVIIDDPSLSPVPNEAHDYWGWEEEYWPAFYGADIVMPSTIKYLTSLYTNSIVVDENNPYYASKDGDLYTKDMKTLLFYSGSNSTIAKKISEKTEVFAPSNGLDGKWGTAIELGKNIKTIDTTYSYEGSEAYTKYPFYITGYKGTAAEKWAKENEIEFIALD